jgi:hypothetical protein
VRVGQILVQANVTSYSSLSKGSLTMHSITRGLGSSITRLSLLALLALTALWLPGPYRALAQGTPPAPAPFSIHLPLLMGSGAAPDLIFTPAAVELAPGAQASVQVRVEPQADLRGASFELPGVQDGVTSSFEAAADGNTGTLTVQASAASEASERPLTVQGISGVDSGKTWVGALRVTTSASLTAKTLFVSGSTGSDSNDGSQAKPFKTLGKALKLALSGDTIELAPGGYGPTSVVSSASGDSFGVNGLSVPAGVIIEGALDFGSQVSTLFGQPGEIALVLQGDASVKNLNIINFNVGLKATTGTQTFSNLLMGNNNFNIGVLGSAKTTLKGSSIALNTVGHGVDVLDQAQFIMDGGLITGGSANCNSATFGLQIQGSAQVSLKNNALLQNIGGQAIDMRNSAKATLDQSTISNVFPVGCKTGPRVSMSDSSSLVLKNSLVGAGDNKPDTEGLNSVGIRSVTSNSSSPTGVSLTLLNSFVTRFTGKCLEMTSKGSIIINGGGISATRSAMGIDAGRKMQLTIANARLEAPGSKGVAIRTATLKLRNSTIASSVTGILVLDFGTIDLGTVADPGNNIIKDGNLAGVDFEGSLSAFGTVDAVGNTWNPNVQGADAQGHYITRRTISGGDVNSSGSNFNLFHSTEHINL